MSCSALTLKRQPCRNRVGHGNSMCTMHHRRSLSNRSPVIPPRSIPARSIPARFIPVRVRPIVSPFERPVDSSPEGSPERPIVLPPERSLVLPREQSPEGSPERPIILPPERSLVLPPMRPIIIPPERRLREQCSCRTIKGTICKNKERVAGCGHCHRHTSDMVPERSGNRVPDLPVYVPRRLLNSRIISPVNTPSPIYRPSNPIIRESTNLDLDFSLEPNSDISTPCRAIKIINNSVHRCKHAVIETSRDGSYCSKHSYVYRLEKPESCPICTEKISDEIEQPLSCGHWAHTHCMKKWGESICPMCRNVFTDEDRARVGIANRSLLDDSNIEPDNLRLALDAIRERNAQFLNDLDRLRLNRNLDLGRGAF